MLKISNSELRTLKRCRRKWWLSYYRRLRQVREGVGALSIGNMVHKPLEVYYATPDRDPATFDWESVLNAYAQERFEDPRLPDHKHAEMQADLELVRIMLRGYFEWLQEDGADSQLRILSAEREIEVYLDTFDLNGARTPVHLMAKLDVEAEMLDGRRVFVDHKSVANLTDLPKVGDLDEQQRMYGLLQRMEAAAAGVQGQRFATGGVWNMLRKVKRSARANPPFYGRAGVHHNDATYRNFYLRVWGEVRDLVRLRAELDAGGEHQVLAYPTPTRDCSWDCPFFVICARFDDGSDVEELLAQEYEEHDPYERYTEVEKG